MKHQHAPQGSRGHELVNFCCRLPRDARALLREQCTRGADGKFIGQGRALARAIFAFYGDPVGRRWTQEEADDGT